MSAFISLLGCCWVYFALTLLIMPHVLLSETRFPPELIGLKIAIALAIGLLAGLGRGWAPKENGVRTFAVVSLLGMASSLLNPGFVMAAFAGVLLMTIFTNARTLMADRSAEIT